MGLLPAIALLLMVTMPNFVVVPIVLSITHIIKPLLNARMICTELPVRPKSVCYLLRMDAQKEYLALMSVVPALLGEELAVDHVSPVKLVLVAYLTKTQLPALQHSHALAQAAILCSHLTSHIIRAQVELIRSAMRAPAATISQLPW